MPECPLESLEPPFWTIIFARASDGRVEQAPGLIEANDCSGVVFLDFQVLWRCKV